MTATAFATITPFEMMLFGETFVTFGGKIKIFAFYEFIFFTLRIVIHSYKNKTLIPMFLIVSKYLIPKGYAGMTVFPFIILRDKKYKLNKTTINHEKIHIRQQLELLIVPFYIWYFTDLLYKYIKYKDFNKAYHNIVFEREAYANENNLDYLPKRNFWSFWKYL